MIFVSGKMGEGYKAAAQLYKKLPNDVEVLNKFGVCYLYIGKTDRAKPIFEKVKSFRKRIFLVIYALLCYPPFYKL